MVASEGRPFSQEIGGGAVDDGKGLLLFLFAAVFVDDASGGGLLACVGATGLVLLYVLSRRGAILLAFCQDFSEGLGALWHVVAESGLFFGFLFLAFLHVFLGILQKEELFLGFHLAADVAAIQRAVPLLLVFLRIELQVDVEPFLIFLDGEDDEDIGLRVVVHILDLVHLDCPHAGRIVHP